MFSNLSLRGPAAACVVRSLIFLALGTIAAGASPEALAANPAAGTVKPSAPQIAYLGDTFDAPNTSDPAGDGSTLRCTPKPTFPCDDFALTLDLPADFAVTNPGAKLKVRIEFPADASDWDLYVLSGTTYKKISAQMQATETDEPVVEEVEFAAGAGLQTLTIRTVPTQPISSEYGATATLIGLAAPTDSDGDGVPDTSDMCPGTPPGTPVNASGCPVAADSDGDGVADGTDLCPGTAPGTTVDANGCPVAADADGDGVADSNDMCPDTPPGSTVDSFGCIVVQADADGDGVSDEDDVCPGTPAGTPVNAAGCPVTPTEPRCIPPGLTVLTDAAGDQVGSSDTDLLNLKISESVTSQRNLVFTGKMSSLASLTSNARRIFTFKAKGADFYVAMINSAESPEPFFDYGTGTSGFGGTDSLGRGLEGSGYNTDGTFTVVAPLSAFGLKAGDKLATFAGVTRLSGGACGAACVNGAAADTATAPAANNYTITADGVCGLVDNSVPQPAGLPPRFQIHASPADLGNDAGEPSVGINRKTNRSMFISYTQALRETYPEYDLIRKDVAGAQLPMACDAKWEDKSGTLTTVNSLDPILFTDEVTGRTFNSQLTGDNSLMEYTDDDGENWTPAQAGPPNGGADHQAVATGPYPAASVPPTASWPASGPKRAVYYCSQSVAAAFCSRSDDGGATFGPGFTFKNTECGAGALHGHVKVAPDGTVYVPDSSQCILPTGDTAEHVLAFVSGDAGQTWAVRDVPFSTGGDSSDPSIGIATDGTTYMCYPNADSTVHVAVSGDKGLSWQGGQDVGKAEGLVQTRFPQMIAGDGDRAACAFLGTKTPGNGDSPDFEGVWYGYIATTYDRGKTWHLVNVTPDDPVQGYGGICCSDNNNRNLLDFNDLQIDEQGRTYFAFADGCIGGCVKDPSKNSFAAKATIVRQTGGRTLFSKYDDLSGLATATPRFNATDAIKPAEACAREDLSTRSIVQSEVRWNAPDTGGSPITDYKVYRSLDPAGPFTLVGDAGTAREFFDTAVKPSVEKYYYRVEAYNALGVSQLGNTIELKIGAQAADPCKLPGEIIAVDATGDAQGGDDMDIVFLGVAETAEAPDAFTITMKIANFTAGTPPPSSFYVLLFPNYNNLYIALNSTNGPASFEYGTFQPDPAGQGFLVYTKGGALAGSSFLADGTIRFVVPRSRFGNPAVGAVIPGFDARARIGAASANSRDTAGNVDYTVRGVAACTAPGIVIADLTADVREGKKPLTVNFRIGGAQSKGKKLTDYSILFGDEQGSNPTPTTGSFGGTAEVTLPHTYSALGTFRARLTVTDETGAVSSNLAEETISVLDNLPPVAKAGPDLEVDEGDTVTLDGSGSSEPDGDSMGFTWTQRSGTPAALGDATAMTPSFTAPAVDSDTTLVYRLTVRDSAGLEDFDEVSVLVHDVRQTGSGPATIGNTAVGGISPASLAALLLMLLGRRFAGRARRDQAP